MLGGHVGSYARLWYFIRYKNLTVEEGLEKMKIEAIMHLKSCIEQMKNQTNVLLTFDQFVGKNQCEVDHGSKQCEVKFTKLSPILNDLIRCNILFYTGTGVFPQNQLIANAISKILRVTVIYRAER